MVCWSSVITRAASKQHPPTDGDGHRTSPCTRISSSPAAAVRQPRRIPTVPTGRFGTHARHTAHRGPPPPQRPASTAPGLTLRRVETQTQAAKTGSGPATAPLQGPYRCASRGHRHASDPAGWRHSSAGYAPRRAGHPCPPASPQWGRDRPQFGHHARAADPLTHTPTQLTQLARHQGGGLVFLTAEFRVGMQMPTQRQQLRQLPAESIGKGPLGSSQDASKPGTPLDLPSAAVASGACCSQSAWR